MKKFMNLEELKCAFEQDFTFLLFSLLLTALLFFLAGYLLGKLFGKPNKTHIKEDTKLMADLQECRKKYDALVVSTSGGKIHRKTDNTVNQFQPSHENKTKKVAKHNPKVVKAENVQVFDKQAAKDIFGKNIRRDDLKLIEGIGPKIASILLDNGINSWKKLADTEASFLKKILDDVGGAAYKIHDPSTWPNQAKLAAEGKLKELKELQDSLKGGKA